jgi:hypothetical protein
MCSHAPVELFAKIPEMPRLRCVALTAVSVRQALYMGTAISNYDDKHAIPALAGHKKLTTRGLPYSVRIMRTDFILG